VFALREAGERARDATAYVTLEPCGLHGRTPPCADALIAAGVQRVVIAAEDTSQAEGAGLARLRAAGITVETGLMREPARELNAGFFHRIERGRPFVRVKLAMSLDGRTALANGASQWITGEAARADGQRWRARSSAILSGSGTILADNPRLTVRLPTDTEIAPPLRVVLDRRLRTPAGSHILDAAAPSLLLHGVDADVPAHLAGVERTVVGERGRGLDLGEVLQRLAARGCNEVHVEAGPTLGGALLEAGLVDELLVYVAPVLLGDDARPLLHLPALADMGARWKLQLLDQRMLGSDLRLRLRPAGA
jgi:diaminohydroxyphosphoribosylaminopyrimidine deaminase/5-amino-6-(5-phosphoribosylamino)uracil reductase